MAIAHLNLRLDNVIFDQHRNIRLIGLSRSFCYFNLDQEKFVKAKRVAPTVVYDHLPPECFDDDDFEPCRADVWSFGLLIYEAVTRTNPRKQHQQQQDNKTSRASRT
ncbi:kinase-like protein, partial [Euroglyphus maynei]